MDLQHPETTQTGDQVSTPCPVTCFTCFSLELFPDCPGLSILGDGCSESSLADEYACCWTSDDIHSGCQRQLITFDMLSDDILLEIFDLYVHEDMGEDFKPRRIQEWIMLAHVSRRWRNVIFHSPHRLNLRLLCTLNTCARDTLDIWPPLPLIIRDGDDIFDDESSCASGVDNIIAALEHNDRVCQIDLRYLTSSYFDITNSAAMQMPFPELTNLLLAMCENEDDEPGPILPDSFLDGSAPRLRSLELEDVPFPGLPKLLLSAAHLVDLSLYRIPRSGYIPPEVMATSLSALTNLESLCLHFQHPRLSGSGPALDSKCLPPPTRSILPRLTKIIFKGTSEYLEVILARIDAPQLDLCNISFFNQIIFYTPQLFHLIRRGPTLRTLEKCHIAFNSKAISVRFSSLRSDYSVLGMEIRCTTSEWQLSSLGQVCAWSLPPVFTSENLYIIESSNRRPHWQGDVENTLWLDLLRSFVSVKNLYLSEEYVPRIAPALQELARGQATKVLPTMENILLEGFKPLRPLHEGIEKFVAARRLASLPVAVSCWHRQREREICDW